MSTLSGSAVQSTVYHFCRFYWTVISMRHEMIEVRWWCLSWRWWTPVQRTPKCSWYAFDYLSNRSNWCLSHTDRQRPRDRWIHRQSRETECTRRWTVWVERCNRQTGRLELSSDTEGIPVTASTRMTREESTEVHRRSRGTSSHFLWNRGRRWPERWWREDRRRDCLWWCSDDCEVLSRVPSIEVWEVNRWWRYCSILLRRSTWLHRYADDHWCPW